MTTHPWAALLWSSSEKVEVVGAFLSSACALKRAVSAFVLESDASPRLWLFSGAPPTHRGSSCLHHGSFFPTEGKQMRSNVNSRLLMNRCAKTCAPAAQLECAASPSILRGGKLLARERVSVQTHRQERKKKKKNNRPHPLPCPHL